MPRALWRSSGGGTFPHERGTPVGFWGLGLRFDLGLVDLQLGVRLALDDLDVHA